MNKFDEIVEEYIDNLKTANKSEYTIRTYVRDIKKFNNFFKFNSVEELGKLDQSDYRKFLSSFDNLSPVSVNGIIRNLSAFIRWLEDNGYVQDSAFFKLRFGKSKYVKVEKKVKDTLSDDEIVGFVKSGRNTQEKFMLALMVFTGIRAGEVCKIKLSDINNCRIVINGKGSKQRRIPLNETLCQMLSLYMSERKTNCEYLFFRGNHGITNISVNNRVLSAMKKSGIEGKKITAHRLRATALTAIIREFGIHAAQKVAGHSSINTTKIYDNSGDEVVDNALLNSKRQFDFGKDL